MRDDTPEHYESDNFPSGTAGRLWRRAIDIGRGYMILESGRKVELELVYNDYTTNGKPSIQGEFDYNPGCKSPGCKSKKAYVIRLLNYTHAGKLQCTKCGIMIKWLSKDILAELENHINNK